MSLKTIRVGLLGAGYIADSHAKALLASPLAQLTAICDRSMGRAQAVAQRYGVTHVTDDLDAMLAGPVDAVHVLLPPDLHAWGARKVLEAGKHVLLEKPMTTNGQEAKALAELVGRGKAIAGVSHNFLFGRAYEQLRADIRSGVFGPIDDLTVNWLYALPFVRHGPFDNWIVRETRNAFVETAPHLLAFVIDLLGGLTNIKTQLAQPLELPTGVTIYRKWFVTAQHGSTSVHINLSMTEGQPDRSLHLRARAGTAVLDFERDTCVRRFTHNPNPSIDNALIALSDVRQLGSAGVRNFVRAVSGTLRKTAELNPYAESFQRSVSVFYEGLAQGKLDERLSLDTGVKVMEVCEEIVTAADLPKSASGAQARLSVSSLVKSPSGSPEVLVLGGSGFIGRHLVAQLVAKGLHVRVATRNALAAAINLRGLEVDIQEGNIGDVHFLRKAAAGVTTVYHLAKTDGKSWAHYQKYEIDVTRAIAEFFASHGVRRFIYTGTIDSYDSADPSKVIDNSTPLDPAIKSRNHYAHSKAVSEGILMKMHRDTGFPVVIVRPGVVIGKGCPPAHWGVGMFISESIVTYWGDGENKIPLVLVEDVADALVKAYDAPNIEGQGLLVTDRPLMSAREYVAEVSRLSGMQIDAQSRSVTSYFAEDVVKEALKYLSSHPNRRPPNKHDWACRRLASRFDSTATEKALKWQPQGAREALVEMGIKASVEAVYQ